MVSDLEKRILEYIEANYREFISILSDLIGIETVSAWKDSSVMKKGAEAVATLLKDIGFRAEIRSYGGHPIVLGELGKGPKSILIYNHYDVQPPDPLELWSTRPFELVEKDGKLYGRGVADNKGNIAARLGAIEALAPYLDELGLKIKYIIEGEEEIGSPTLHKAVEDLKQWLKADGGFWETGYVDRRDRLRIPLGFKGMVYIEVILRGASRDVHSGLAPLIPNPVWRLAKFLTLLKDPNGRILVPWIYEDIEHLGSEAEKLLKELDIEELEELKKELGIREFAEGLSGFKALRKLHLEPSLNVSGLYAGYTRKGSKTIVPSLAGVKIDIRLVPGQKPNKIIDRFKKFLKENGLGDSEIIIHGAYPSGYTKPSEKIVRASVIAGEKVYENKPVLIPLSPGSGPLYLFTNYVGTPMTGAGVGYYDSKVHAPNENIRVVDFVKSMKHVALTILEFAKIAKVKLESTDTSLSSPSL